MHGQIEGVEAAEDEVAAIVIEEAAGDDVATIIVHDLESGQSACGRRGASAGGRGSRP